MDHPVTRQVAGEYLAPLRAARIDTLVLGCTHYGVLRGAIQSVLDGDQVILVDSGAEVAREVESHLGPGAPEPAARWRFYVSDIPARFREVGSRFLGRPLDDVALVDQTDILVRARSGFLGATGPGSVRGGSGLAGNWRHPGGNAAGRPYGWRDGVAAPVGVPFGAQTGRAAAAQAQARLPPLREGPA
jgi:hypothetical protein